jgi:membrane fusion protein, copper/silver efflux system
VGAVQEILPQVNPATRTLQARFEVDNKGAKLTPGMLLRLQVAGPTTSRLMVPSEAVIRTGTRAVAVVRQAHGNFEPRELTLGVDLGDTLEVVAGLAEGDQVVVSGQFMVDSEARLRSVLGNMAAAVPASTAASASVMAASAPESAATYSAQGTVESVEAGSLTLSHGAVPELKWPPMTMGFRKPGPDAFHDVKVGDRVRFEFRKTGGDFVLVAVYPMGGSK